MRRIVSFPGGFSLLGQAEVVEKAPDVMTTGQQRVTAGCLLEQDHAIQGLATALIMLPLFPVHCSPGWFLGLSWNSLSDWVSALCPTLFFPGYFLRLEKMLCVLDQRQWLGFTC